MPLAQAMWTHGHAIRIESPERLSSVWRAGFFVRLIGKRSENVWVHYAIPTPVIVKDNRLNVDSVMIRCRTIAKDDAWIAAVHIYDGEQIIASHDNLRQNSADWSFLRYAVSGHPDVRWGIGISINIRFTDVAFANVPLGDLGNPQINIPGGLDSVITLPRPTAQRSQMHYAIEISSVGCDFLT